MKRSTSNSFLLATFFLSGILPLANASTYLVTNTDDSGQGSLREAIEQANTNPGLDFIHFNIPGAGPHEIAPVTVLPFVTDPAVIDGYSQPGAAPATASSNAIIKIGLSGAIAGTDAHGFAVGSGCTIRGIAIYSFGSAVNMATDDNVVEGCYIGLDVSGAIAMGNQYDGIFITGQRNRIGGPAPAQRNVIAANGNGIAVFPYAPNNVIQGNYVGADASGTITIANGSDGIGVGSADNRIVDNLVVGHPNANILIGWWSDDSPYPDGNLVQGNRIGHHIDGSLSTGINCIGVNIFASTNTTVRDNIIFGNNCHGVSITNDASTGNLITTNSIYGNGGLGINLSDNGVTPNDPGDLDVGPNNLLNYPVLTEALSNNGIVKVAGFIDAPDPKSLRIEFYGNSVPHSSGYGGGETYLGAVKPKKDGEIKVGIPAVPPGTHISALAIDMDNNTSEFALNIEAVSNYNLSGVLSTLSDGNDPATNSPAVIAYPNPFVRETYLSFYLPEEIQVQLDVYEISGKRIQRLVNGRRSAGYHRVKFDGSRMPEGIYLYHLRMGSHTYRGKLLLQR